jgi:hypothetical protein
MPPEGRPALRPWIDAGVPLRDERRPGGAKARDATAT